MIADRRVAPMPDDPIVAVSKVSKNGLVQIPLEIREKLDLKPGTKLIVVAAEDMVGLKKAEVLVARAGFCNLERRQSLDSHRRRRPPRSICIDLGRGSKNTQRGGALVVSAAISITSGWKASDSTLLY